MKISNIEKKFNSLGYVSNKSTYKFTFNKEDISFHIIKQRWEGLELYLHYNKKVIKLDWTFELYLKEKELEDIIKSVGEKTTFF